MDFFGLCYLSNDLIQNGMKLFVFLEVTLVKFRHRFVMDNFGIATVRNFQLRQILQACAVVVAKRKQ